MRFNGTQDEINQMFAEKIGALEVELLATRLILTALTRHLKGEDGSSSEVIRDQITENVLRVLDIAGPEAISPEVKEPLKAAIRGYLKKPSSAEIINFPKE